MYVPTSFQILKLYLVSFVVKLKSYREDVANLRLEILDLVSKTTFIEVIDAVLFTIMQCYSLHFMTLSSYIHPHPTMICHPSNANAKDIAPPACNRRNKEILVSKTTFIEVIDAVLFTAFYDTVILHSSPPHNDMSPVSNANAKDIAPPDEVSSMQSLCFSHT